MEKVTIKLDGQEFDIITKDDADEKQDEVIIDEDLDKTMEMEIISNE